MRNVVVSGAGGMVGFFEGKPSQIKDMNTHDQPPAEHAGEAQTRLQQEG